MSSGEIILYRADDGSRVRLRASGGTVWLTQAEMAGLYDTSVPNIAQIVRRVLADGEVTAETVNSELMVRVEGAHTVRRTLLAEDRYELYDQRRRALDAQEADEADLRSLRELEHRADPTKDDGGGGHERSARRS
ncbi:hypothetical protein [Propionibacterium acidifaciens]|uniref:hypothetical protein n=1 Tax=Propionibacterium acidifaciens TaxID=556499 RepID=UPI0028E864F0|nr:hypothetical protein [Propionibacterium acidifaciens]